MNLIQNLWNVLITEDENLIKYFLVVLTFLEIYSTLRLFTSILNINYTKKQRNLYYIFVYLYMLLAIFVIPNEYAIFITIIYLPTVVKLVFKVSTLKSILCELTIFSITAFFETLYVRLTYQLFGISLAECMNIPIFRIPLLIVIYITIIISSIIIKNIKLNLKHFNFKNLKQHKILILNVFFILICIAMQFYLLIFYNNILPMYICFISLTSFIAYAFISFYSLFKTINLETTKKELEQSQLHNKTLELLYSNISAFKHDFSNILTAFGGYIFAKNMDGMEKYYNKIVEECHINNNLSTLNPNVINNPAIYNILATKYYKADELGISINLEVFINLNELKMDIYDFCRSIGILLDNAIEAAAKCNKKIVNIDMHDIKIKKQQIITIENTYSNKDIEISKLSEKGYTTKTEDTASHGIGLWQVSKIIKKHQNIILNTSKSEDFFKQEITIYY